MTYTLTHPRVRVYYIANNFFDRFALFKIIKHPGIALPVTYAFEIGSHKTRWKFKATRPAWEWWVSAVTLALTGRVSLVMDATEKRKLKM